MAATGQAMAYRCEQCGSPEIVARPSYTSRGLAASLDATPLASASPILRRQLLRRDHAVTFALVWGGDSYSSLLLLGTPRIECNIAAFKSTHFSRDHGCCAIVFGLYAYLEIAL